MLAENVDVQTPDSYIFHVRRGNDRNLQRTRHLRLTPRADRNQGFIARSAARTLSPAPRWPAAAAPPACPHSAPPSCRRSLAAELPVYHSASMLAFQAFHLAAYHFAHGTFQPTATSSARGCSELDSLLGGGPGQINLNAALDVCFDAQFSCSHAKVQRLWRRRLIP